jgi:hypothetical protein
MDDFEMLLQEIFILNNSFNEDDSFMNSTLYERNPIKFVISEEAKKELIFCKYSQAKNKEACTFCCITQDEFKEDDDIIQLACEHCFYPEPIMKWLTEESSSCPMCKKTFDSVEVRQETIDENFCHVPNNSVFDNIFFDVAFDHNNLGMYNNLWIYNNFDLEDSDDVD